MRHSAARIGEQPRQVIRFRVPTDDYHDQYFLDRLLSPQGWPADPAGAVAGRKAFKKDQPGVYQRVQDGWWNLPNREQDRVAQETQGAIADRTKEHLATSDQGILMLRKMIRESIDAVAQGKDPFGVFANRTSDPITFDSSRDAVEALS